MSYCSVAHLLTGDTGSFHSAQGFSSIARVAGSIVLTTADPTTHAPDPGWDVGLFFMVVGSVSVLEAIETRSISTDGGGVSCVLGGGTSCVGFWRLLDSGISLRRAGTVSGSTTCSSGVGVVCGVAEAQMSRLVHNTDNIMIYRVVQNNHS